jgi:hypothetical protein
MKVISIVELQRNPGKALEEVPVLITKHKKKWRIVTGVNVDQSTYNSSINKTPIKSNLCPHGSPFGLCKKGCK